MTKLRNEPCPCGSGLRYKRCCGKIPNKPASALPIMSSHASTEFDQLVALFHAGQYAEMESRSRLLVEQYPDLGFAWKLLGTALGVQGKDALFALRKAAELLPDDIDVHNNLGNVLQDLRQFEGAAASYRRALEIEPDIAEMHNNLGNTLLEIRQLDNAVASYRQALELKPDYAEAHNNLGNALKNLGQCNGALDSYRRALEIAPDFAEAHINYANLLLSLGAFERGWQEYEWRPISDGGGRFPADPRTQSPFPKASALLPFTAQGKRILLVHEQGIGDELFFLRFARQLRGQAQWVGYLATDKVRSLIERAGCVDQVLSRVEEDLLVDLNILVGDLPLLLRCYTSSDIPQSLRLSPTNQHVANVRQRLSELGLVNQRLLGITWRAGSPPGPGMPKGLFKQVGLDLLGDTIKDWNGVILVLQRKPAAGEIEQLHAQVSCPVYDFSEYNDDLESMLALLDTLDEYVGVSNTNMHLMATLGKTARVIVQAPADWRWMASGDESPWFPGFSLYRQSVTGDWGQALTRLSSDLSNYG